MKRKIIQITAQSQNNEGDGAAIIALADDGTLWEGYPRYYPQSTPRHKFEWSQLPPLPDDNSNLGKVK